MTGQIRGGRSWHHHLWTLTHKPKHTSQEANDGADPGWAFVASPFMDPDP